MPKSTKTSKTKTTRRAAVSKTVSAPVRITGLPLGKMFSIGWQTLKTNVVLLLVLFIISLIVQSVPSFLTGFLTGGNDPGDSGVSLLVALISLVGTILNIVIGMGWIKIMVKLTRGESAQISDLFGSANRIIPYAVASLLSSLIIVVGLVALVVPGIYFMLRLMFVPYLVVDKKFGVMQAFDGSAAMSDGMKMNLLGFVLVSALINIVGLLLLLVGLVVTVPVTALAHAAVYNYLVRRATKA